MKIEKIQEYSEIYIYSHISIQWSKQRTKI